MLVCNVSLRPPRRAIAANVAEITAAVDALATGNVVFAALVDDPASVGDFVDAYLGEIMLEAASADATVDSGFAFAAAVTEAVTAATAQDATTTSAPGTATFDGTATNVTLSNGNLTATHNTTTDQSGARSTALKSAGKFYFEVTVGATHGGADTAGVVLSTGTYANMNSGNNCSEAFLTFASGHIYSNNADTFQTIGGAAGPGDVICVAIDLDNRKAWFRKNNGNWNNQPTDNPATGATSVVMAASGSFAPAVSFGSSGSAVGDNMTANFGASTFAFSVPSGFTAGWSA
jgi:hypothetical protein